MKQIPVRVYLFDCLYDGEDLTLTPYPKRTERLAKPVEKKLISDPVELEKFFQLAITEGTEGLVVKSTSDDSIYRAGAHSWLWVKLKRRLFVAQC